MQVTTAPVSNRHEKVLFPALTANLGLILSQLKGIMFSNSLLQVAIEIVHKLRISCGMTLGAWMLSGSLVKNLLLSLELSILRIIVAGQIHSRPIGMTLFVFIWLLVSDSFKTMFLRVILQLAVETVFAILVGIVAWSGSGFVVGRRPLVVCSRGVGFSLSIHILGKLLLLEGSYLFVHVTVLPFLWVDGGYGLLNFGPGFPLGVRSNLIHFCPM
jgi:hypothetical protein